MSTQARAALARLVGALEAHLDAVERRRSETDPVVKDAYQSLSDAFETYDEALYDAFDEVTPFVLFDDSDEDDDDLEDEDFDEDDDDPEEGSEDDPDDDHPRL